LRKRLCATTTDACDCHPSASLGASCDAESGQCTCRNSYGGRQCLHCQVGFYDYPTCKLCSCDPTGTTEEVCSNQTGQCLCKPQYGGPRCDQCAPGFYNFPNCIPCECDSKGSLGNSCDNAGKCHCLASFTGLRCDQCAPGYYSYPDCNPCGCDSYGSVGLSCGSDGTCFCKPSFDGEKCDRCKKGFYNYPLCEGCNCNPAGILATFGGCGSLTSGELCECKERVTGRICDQCRPLYWNLKPSDPQGCEDCECHSPGTLGGLRVCDGQSGQCLRKPNVGQHQCTECLDGTFHLQDQDLLGCQDCQCDVGGAVGSSCDARSGQCQCRPRITGRRCSEPLQAHFFPTLHQHKYEVEDGHTPSGVNARFDFDSGLFPGFSWKGYAIFSNIQVLVLPPSREPRFQGVVGQDGVTALPFVLNPGRWTLSIKAPRPVFLDYMVLLPEAFYEATLLQERVRHPCLRGGNMAGPCRQLRYPALPDTAVPVAAAQGADGQGAPVQILDDADVLEELHSGPMAHLDEDHGSLRLDLRVPRAGPHALVFFYHSLDNDGSVAADLVLSGADRLATGRANFHHCNYNLLCRQVRCTGCFASAALCTLLRCCVHPTHSVALGNHDNCLICACPIPLPSNNFADSCEVSPSGQEISCNCKKGYYGPRCDVCDAGYFGEPDVIGSSCKPCECSGNIDPANPASCDSVTGECVLCLNNTSGPACELCAPGFYGDAISVKDCRKCSCNQCGMHSCNPLQGTCNCHSNVEGSLCDRCAPNHWGFSECRGCRSCDCSLASQSKQCDLKTGQCPCQPGAGGPRCDVCEPGYWRYSADGRISCNCAAKFSAGAVCNQQTGQCQCLPGVEGDKCDRCPYRWVFVEREGCKECGECVHALLDDTDSLEQMIDNIGDEMRDISSTYLANQRLQLVNQTAHDLKEQLMSFSGKPASLDVSPLAQNVSDLEALASTVRKDASSLALSATANNHTAYKTRLEADREELNVEKTVQEMRDILSSLTAFSEGLGSTSTANVEPLLDEATRIVELLNATEFMRPFAEAEEELAQAGEGLERAQNFSLPAVQNDATLEDLRQTMAEELEGRLYELANHTQRVEDMVREVAHLQNTANSSPFRGIIAQSEELKLQSEALQKEARELLRACQDYYPDAENAYEGLRENSARLRDMVDQLQTFLEKLSPATEKAVPYVREAEIHSHKLQQQARECQTILNSTQQTSSSALAYDEIAKIIDEAQNISEAALATSNEAHDNKEMPVRAERPRFHARSLQHQKEKKKKIKEKKDDWEIPIVSRGRHRGSPKTSQRRRRPTAPYSQWSRRALCNTNLLDGPQPPPQPTPGQTGMLHYTFGSFSTQVSGDGTAERPTFILIVGMTASRHSCHGPHQSCWSQCSLCVTLDHTPAEGSTASFLYHSHRILTH
ncbi:laminin subunit alpha-like, partial [Ixodes scapularis]|uniref:laminin subunit alpha-like n=1 Tax=Ixodes scapularis TaxID=6945 RepID=UPI001C388602